MNLFYEDYPTTIFVAGEEIPIVTDFREYVKLIDTLNDDSLSSAEKYFLLSQYFLYKPSDFVQAMEALTSFVLMETEGQEDFEKTEKYCMNKREVYSFQYDYPFIFSAFLSEYGINIREIPYMHWWEFRNLFDGLPENMEIKQRMYYRSIDLNTIKNKEERKRIQKIQNAIRLPQNDMSDYDIGDAFEW